nr:hypothetical protein [Rickettsia endosymbiont of Ceutorhynchus assimilis]
MEKVIIVLQKKNFARPKEGIVAHIPESLLRATGSFVAWLESLMSFPRSFVVWF